METLKLPVSDFQWVSKTEFKKWTAEDIINIPSQDDTGYAFEVDLHYPSHLHQVNPIFVVITLFIVSDKLHDIIFRHTINFRWLRIQTRFLLNIYLLTIAVY